MSRSLLTLIVACFNTAVQVYLCFSYTRVWQSRDFPRSGYNCVSSSLLTFLPNDVHVPSGFHASLIHANLIHASLDHDDSSEDDNEDNSEGNSSDAPTPLLWRLQPPFSLCLSFLQFQLLCHHL